MNIPRMKSRYIGLVSKLPYQTLDYFLIHRVNKKVRPVIVDDLLNKFALKCINTIYANKA